MQPFIKLSPLHKDTSLEGHDFSNWTTLKTTWWSMRIYIAISFRSKVSEWMPSLKVFSGIVYDGKTSRLPGETRPCMLLENFATLNVGCILLTESKNNNKLSPRLSYWFRKVSSNLGWINWLLTTRASPNLHRPYSVRHHVTTRK